MRFLLQKKLSRFDIAFKRRLSWRMSPWFSEMMYFIWITMLWARRMPMGQSSWMPLSRWNPARIHWFYTAIIWKPALCSVICGTMKTRRSIIKPVHQLWQHVRERPLCDFCCDQYQHRKKGQPLYGFLFLSVHPFSEASGDDQFLTVHVGSYLYRWRSARGSAHVPGHLSGQGYGSPRSGCPAHSGLGKREWTEIAGGRKQKKVNDKKEAAAIRSASFLCNVKHPDRPGN